MFLLNRNSWGQEYHAQAKTTTQNLHRENGRHLSDRDNKIEHERHLFTEFIHTEREGEREGERESQKLYFTKIVV